MQQFFINDLSNPKFSKDQVHQITKVLRMRKGDQMRLVDINGNGALFSIINLEPLELFNDGSLEFHKKSYSLKLVASLIRTERLEWMIQKACESGVDEIVLYSADHGVVKDFGKREERKLERLNTIALEACEQSYRQYPVKVRGIISKDNLKDEVSDISLYGEIGEYEHLVDVVKKDLSITVVIGPEGGFSASERTLLDSLGYQPVSLGNNVFRAETASIAVCNFVSLLDKD